MSGGAPSRVRCSIDDREFLVELFVNLFEVTAAEDSVRRDLAGHEVAQPSHADAQGTDFRSDVERWLEHVLR